MPEHGIEAEMCGIGVSSSFSKMSGQEEGIYASSASIDAGLQRKDQIGLTLSPKISSEAKIPLGTCMITDQDLEDALRQLEPLLAEAEGKTPSFRVDAIHGSHHSYVTAPAKRRKPSGDVYESLFHRLPPSPRTWSKSLGLNVLSPESGNICATSSYNAGRHEDGGGTHLSAHKPLEILEEADPKLVALKPISSPLAGGRGSSIVSSESTVLREELWVQARKVQNGQDFEASNQRESAGLTTLRQGKDLWDPDIAIQSIEGGNIGVDSPTPRHRSQSHNSGKVTVRCVPVGSSPPVNRTVAGLKGWATNGATQESALLQDSPQSSRHVLQTPSLASLAELFLRNSQQALFDDYSKSLSTHQIPAELRKHFHSLLRKYQSDAQFRKGVASYAMELSGAVIPGEKPVGEEPVGEEPVSEEPVILPPRLRQGFDALLVKWRSEQGFRMSVDKFVEEYLRGKISRGEVSSENGPREVAPSGTFEPDANMQHVEYKPMDLTGLSLEEVTRHCRKLEYFRALHANNAREAKVLAKNLLAREQVKPRILHHPDEPNPNPGTWTCYNSRTTGFRGKLEPCGRSNPNFEKKLVWRALVGCKTCGGPFKEEFKLQKQMALPKKHKKPTQDKGKATVSPAGQQPTDSQVNDFAALPATHQDHLFNNPSNQMHGRLDSDGNVRQRQFGPGLDSHNYGPQQTNTSHSALMSNTLSYTNYGTTNGHPVQNSYFQEPIVEHTESPELGIDSNTQDIEYDDHAIDSDPLFTEMELNQTSELIDSDPLFTEMDLNPSPELAGLFFEDTTDFPEDLILSEDGLEQLTGPIPGQADLFPRLTVPSTQPYRSSSVLHPPSAGGNSEYGAGFGSSLSSILQDEDNIGWVPIPFGQSSTNHQSANYSPHSSGQLLSGFLPDWSPTENMFSTRQSSGSASLSPPAAALHPTQTTMLSSNPGRMMPKTGPTIEATDTDSEAFVPGDQSEGSIPYPWAHKRPKNPHLERKKRNPNGRGQGWNALQSSTATKRPTSQKPRPSRSKEAVAERAALKLAAQQNPSLTTAQLKETAARSAAPFTDVQLRNVAARNETSAMMIGGPRKSWEKPLHEHPLKAAMESPDDDVEMEEGVGWEEGSLLGATLEDDALGAALNFEFDRQDQAAALEAADESEISEEE